MAPEPIPAPGEVDSAFDTLAEVAAASELREGAAGVLRVLRALTGLPRLSTKAIGRDTKLPVPVVAAVLGELRTRGYVSPQSPPLLTVRGRTLTGHLGVEGAPLPPELRSEPAGAPSVPDVLRPVVERLDSIVADGPEVDLELDQSFCTGATKVRRVLHMLATGGLPTPALLAVGDDDLVSVAVALVQSALGRRLVGRLAVVDISPRILTSVEEHLAQQQVAFEVLEHDLREPLPATFTGRFSVAVTDPPYTVGGARLFVSRALEGLRPGAGWDLYLHFGSRDPQGALELQLLLAELGLATASLTPGFSEYVGSGVLAGRSDAYHLVAAGPAPTAPYLASGPLYTAEVRQADRGYACADCGETYLVGPGGPWPSVGALKQAGCRRCRATRFVPGQLQRRAEPVVPRVPGPASAPPPGAPGPSSQPEHPNRSGRPEAGVSPDVTAGPGQVASSELSVRPATSADLAAIVAFEVEIAQVSFGQEAVTDQSTHAKRVGAALERDPDGMLVAIDPAGAVLGWMWMSINTNFLTKQVYASFRSLAVADVPNRSEVARLLLGRGIRFARQHAAAEVVGKVYAGNLAMRVVYREFGFEARHLTMRLQLEQG